MKIDVGPTQETLQEIDVLIRARYPILYLLTHEEARLEVLLHQLASKQGKSLFTWTSTSGLSHFDPLLTTRQNPRMTDATEVLQHIQAAEVSAFFLLKDFHAFLDNPQIIRRLRDLAHELKGTYKSIIIASPRLQLPVELEKEITLIDFPLPDAKELTDLLRSVAQSLRAKSPGAVTVNNQEAGAIVRAAQGLTLSEAENVFSKAVVRDASLNKNDVALVLKEKQQLIRKSGILEFYNIESTLDEIGGLLRLKHWLAVRENGFTQKAVEFGLPSPKGVLLLGAPGCGKSLTAKAVASAWQIPLLRLDFGRIFSGYIGSSEENMRRALKVAEGVAPAVLWIDEIEKGLAGGASSTSDAGTSARVFGTFLTWMQEKTAKVFVVATANRIDALPPELLRRGRFDEVFFMDLPSVKAREEILGIHLKKRARKVKEFDVARIAALTDGYSGAELEHCVVEGLFAAFHQKRALTTDDIVKAASETVPLSVTYAEELRRSREWARTRARPADDVDILQDAGTKHIRLDVPT